MIEKENGRTEFLKKIGCINLLDITIPKNIMKILYILVYMGYKPGPYLWEEKAEYDAYYSLGLDESRKDAIAILYNKRQLSQVGINFCVEEVLFPKLNETKRNIDQYDLYLSNNKIYVLKEGKEEEKEKYNVPTEAIKLTDGNLKDRVYNSYDYYYNYFSDKEIKLKIELWFNKYSKPVPEEGNPKVDNSVGGEYNDLYKYVLSTRLQRVIATNTQIPGYHCDISDEYIRGIDKRLAAEFDANERMRDDSCTRIYNKRYK